MNFEITYKMSPVLTKTFFTITKQWVFTYAERSEMRETL